jgi:hypothetical protein
MARRRPTKRRATKRRATKRRATKRRFYKRRATNRHCPKRRVLKRRATKRRLRHNVACIKTSPSAFCYAHERVGPCQAVVFLLFFKARGLARAGTLCA